MLRGDDVAELQQRLSALGFDTGRVDGIFGDLTSAALGEFQRNVGLPVDGIAGAVHRRRAPAVRHPPRRHRAGDLGAGPRAAPARRRAPWPAGGWPSARRAGSTPPVAALRRLLVSHGAVVTTHHHPDGSIQASEANAGGAEVYIGLRLDVGRPPLLDCLLRRLPLLLARRATTGRAPPGDPLACPRACPTGAARACRSRCSARPGCRR